MALDTAEVTRLARLSAEAPRGPWSFEPARSPTLLGQRGLVLGSIHSGEAGAFIVAARETVPELLQERETLIRLVRQHIVQFGVCLACGPIRDGHALRCPALPFLTD
jgi:hypothetical protein